MPVVRLCSKCNKYFMVSTYGLIEHYKKCNGVKSNNNCVKR